jgi:serine/threonine-protein kinase
MLLVLLTAGGALWFFRGRSAAAPEQPSIAVLPFVDMSAEKNQEYFSEGIAEQLRNSLARIDGLRVVGRTSSFKFKGTTDDSRSIGKALNVATILEGSVDRQGNRARINVQLVKTSDGFILWHYSDTPDMSDIFAVQDTIASEVTKNLRVKLLGNKASSTNADAYNAYLQGRYFLARSSKENRAKAATYFEQATRLDAGYAPAWVGWGDALINQAGSGDVEDGYQKAREKIARALTLDANLSDAHAAMGEIQMLYDWDWTGAEASFQSALASKPGDAGFLRDEGALQRILDRESESVRLYQRAVQIEPLSGNYGLALALHYAGRQEEAKKALAKALEITPEMDEAHTLLARIYLAQKRPREALDEASKEAAPAWRMFGLALTYHALGRKLESDTQLAQLIAQFGHDAQYQIAGVYAFRGELDQAFEWLERTYKERDSGLAEMKADPLLKSLAGDPRYRALLKKIGLPL